MNIFIFLATIKPAAANYLGKSCQLSFYGKHGQHQNSQWQMIQYLKEARFKFCMPKVRITTACQIDKLYISMVSCPSLFKVVLLSLLSSPHSVVVIITPAQQE